MMIPITRKEKYINEIVGGGNTAPETPQTREELFFADILGEVVAPSPITRAEKYLAKIANKYSGELPEPVTRIERFLARAAGMDVTIPTPITREEIFWADYALIVEKELSGIPPLRFNTIAGALKNYRIYGNTVNGESVGDRTANLFDVNDLTGGSLNPYDGKTVINNGQLYTETYIPVLSNTDYTLSGVASALRCHQYNSNFAFLGSELITGTFTTNAQSAYIRLAGSVTEFIQVMLNKGSTSLPYEPYGYRVPVTVTNGTDTQTKNIYLTDQIKMVGDEAEYIDFMEQKQHFADGTSADVTLPAMPTLSGTNMLSVGTEVQPSSVYIKYKGAR